jgi:ribosome biogenesis GTPase
MAKKKGGKKSKLRRVAFRRNRSQPARDKSWTREYKEHQFEDKAVETRQTSIPKGDMSRKRTIVDPDDDCLDLVEGTVVAMRGLYADVDTGGEIISCTTRRVLRTRLIDERHPVTVGDIVKFEITGEGAGVERSGVIRHVQDRRSKLTRRYAKRAHVIAANVDQVVIVVAVAEPTLKRHLIDRYLIAAHAGNIEPLICLNKIDLAPEVAPPVVDMYTGIGYDVVTTSIVTRAGMDQLAAALVDKTSAVVGQSGVGKSSLLNAIEPELQLSTGEVSAGTEKGRHTTTQSRLIQLRQGGYVVDTPGIRSYEMADVEPHEYEMHFIDLARFVPHCKFPNCTHIHEADCAVIAAVESGEIHEERYDSYVYLFQDG